MDILPELVEEEDLCIECGLGSLVTGGYSQDRGNRIGWNCTVRDANRIIADLVGQIGDEGTWIELF